MGLNIIESTNDKEVYHNDTFTSKGYDSLSVYLAELIKMYAEENRNYPFKLGLVLGVPMMKHSQIILSKEDLLSRIKMLAQVLGLNTLKANIGESGIITINIGDLK